MRSLDRESFFKKIFIVSDWANRARWVFTALTCLIAGSLGNVFSLDGILPVEESAGLTELPGGPNLATLVNTIQGILQDSAYTNDSIVEKIDKNY